jgi:hypothetical protein
MRTNRATFNTLLMYNAYHQRKKFVASGTQLLVVLPAKIKVNEPAFSFVLAEDSVEAPYVTMQKPSSWLFRA